MTDNYHPEPAVDRTDEEMNLLKEYATKAGKYREMSETLREENSCLRIQLAQASDLIDELQTRIAELQR